jgi:hypothetical protein
MSAALQVSIDQRAQRSRGQARQVLHVPPQTIDEYASFVGTSTMPGNWIGMNFSYGNDTVTATVSIATWNPTRPSTYYQMGSQYFINDAFLTYSPEPIGPVRLRTTIGYFSNSYGGLSQYGNGIYTNPVVGGPYGIGETTIAEFELTDSVNGVIEHGIMAARDGKAPNDLIAANDTRNVSPVWASSWVHHLHLGIVTKGEPQLAVQVHHMRNWSQEDRTRMDIDNPQTRAVDETEPKDGRIDVYGLNARLSHPVYGYLAVGAALIDAENAYVLRGMKTYAGDAGEQLTDRWLGVSTGGTGKLYVAAINYSASIGKIVAHPRPFPGDGPDLVVNAGFHIASTDTDFERFDGRVRHKYGIDGLYTFLSWMGAGVRVDRVVPNSKDSAETFHVLAPRLQFKTDWNSREAIQLLYAKWFYGSRTRNEGTGERTPDRLDDQLVALSFNMWW